MSLKIVIPARFDSSRLPGKPLLPLLDKPLVVHVFDRCLEAGIDSSNIFVATDDQRIFDILENLGVQVVFTSNTHVSGTDRINEVAQIKGWSDDTIILNIQGDEPLIPPRLIQELIAFTKFNANFDITTAVVPIHTNDDFINPNLVKAVLGHNGRALNFTRSASPINRDNPSDLSLARRHIGIYCYRVSVLRHFCSYPESSLENFEKLEQLRALSNGMSVGAILFDGLVNHGIDTYDEYIKIKKIIEERLY